MNQNPLDLVLSRLPNARKSGEGWAAKCPVHDDHNASLSLNVGEDGRALLHCHAGCEPAAICETLGLKLRDLMPASNGKPRSNPGKIVAAYSYRDENGRELYQVVRYEPKTFRQRRPKPGGGWEWKRGDRQILYRLPELLAAKPTATILIAEGEKDCDRLRSLGAVATCNPGGAGKWRDEYAEHLRGRRVILFHDNDQSGVGLRHAHDIARSAHDNAAAVKIVTLPGQYKDVSEYLDAGHGKDDLCRLISEAPTWTPTAAEPEPATPATAGDDADGDGYQPFPTDALPPVVRDFVRQVATALGCDDGYVVLPLLAALASAVGNSRRIKLKNSWPEPCIVWSAIVGDSGTLKSPALDHATRPLHDLQRAAFAEWREALEQYEQDKAMYEADAATWRKSGRKAGEPPPTPPAEPVCTRYVADDTTIEALAPLLRNNPRGLLVSRDELSGWVNSFDAYKNSRGADVAKWLTVHGGRPLIVDRVTGRRIIHVPRAAVSICGGVQPKALAAALMGRYAPRDGESDPSPASREHFDNGLAARLIFTMPPRRRKRWTDDDLPDEAWAGIRYVFEQLLALPMDQDDSGDPMPVDLPLTPSGRCAWKRFYRDHADEEFRLAGDLGAAWSKLESYAARFALLMHLVRSVTGDATLETHDAIDEQSIAAGVAISRWAGDETVRVYAAIGGDVEKPEARERRLLLRIVRDHGGRLTARQLMHASRQYRGGVEVAERALAGLAAAGLGTWGVNDHGGGPGRPVQVFALHDTDDAGGPADAPPDPPTAPDTDESDGDDADEVTEWTA